MCDGGGGGVDKRSMLQEAAARVANWATNRNTLWATNELA